MKIARRLDEDIDRLYRLPLESFTPARNALAKTAGADAAAVRALEKPSIAAWAVNQLYWQKRAEYDALVEAAEHVRAAHKAVLGGKSGALRETGEAHEKEIERATKAAVSLLSDGGHPVTDATKQAIVTTLRALPSGTPGRLVKPLQPGGFEMLAGLTLKKGPAPAPAPAPRPAPTPKGQPKGTKALTRAREAATAATRALRDAEHAAKRTEFELARATREAEQADKALASAQRALERAQQEAEEAEAAAESAGRARESAARRAEEAAEAVEKAGARLRRAEEDVQSLDDR
jgi:hypothetical protein